MKSKKSTRSDHLECHNPATVTAIEGTIVTLSPEEKGIEPYKIIISKVKKIPKGVYLTSYEPIVQVGSKRKAS